ncbi:hypothetical protein ACIOG3_03590 [Yersinia rochesterensis]|uniref:hypothetical protein n=1 Tax=Yersinia TaxID=629 RepID=UPI000AA1F19A
MITASQIDGNLISLATGNIFNFPSGQNAKDKDSFALVVRNPLTQRVEQVYCHS